MTVKDQFALGRGMWAMVTFIYGFFLFGVLIVVVDVVTNPSLAGSLFELFLVGAILISGWSIFFRMSRRVEIVEDGLQFVAPTRTVLIPWRSLQSVSSPRTDINSQSLRWNWEGGTLRAWGPYDHDLARLLHIVRHNAPNADLERAVTRRPSWWGRRVPRSR